MDKAEVEDVATVVVGEVTVVSVLKEKKKRGKARVQKKKKQEYKNNKTKQVSDSYFVVFDYIPVVLNKDSLTS
tara:strand:+ start:749 stop:967 length:219 start_codon:yes stop_codon:yes gene_type:complete